MSSFKSDIFGMLLSCGISIGPELYTLALQVALPCIQAEKRKMLMEHETQKIQELDEQYQNELKEWKGQLRPRKQVIISAMGAIGLLLNHNCSICQRL